MTPRRIFDAPPTDWRDLQNLVRVTFTEIGCDAVCDARLATVRGEVNVDVLVNDMLEPPAATYVIECKLWRRRVPRTVAHAIRTVVADSGASCGFIISESGFQRGARDAVASSNVQLLTWAEFQEVFFDRWVSARGTRLREVSTPLREFMHGMSDPVSSIVQRSKEAEALWYAMFTKFSAYVPWLSDYRLNSPVFPVTCVDPRPRYDGPSVFTSAREYFDVLEAALPMVMIETERFVERHSSI